MKTLKGEKKETFKLENACPGFEKKSLMAQMMIITAQQMT